MKLFIIAKSNINKNKSISITLVALIIFATILLYIGSSIILNMNSFLDDKNKELNGSDFTAVAPKEVDEMIQKTLSNMEGPREVESKAAIYKMATDFQNITINEKKQSIGCLILNADDKEKISKLSIIDEGKEKPENAIVLPYYLKSTYDYKTGDEITITYGGNTNQFTVYGFAEDIIFSTPSNVPIYKCYVFNEEFQKLYAAEQEDAKVVIVKAKLKEGMDTSTFEEDFVKQFYQEHKITSGDLMTLNYDSMKSGTSMFLVIIMALLIVFSLIIIMIALTVMRFAIVTHIEGNIKNIGSLEAMGYTGGQLIGSTLLQFVFLTFISIIIGFLIAISLIGIVTNIASSAIGLAWNGRFNIAALIITISVITILVIIITYFTSAKIKKITPITAMRSGIHTHNFKRNHFPLSKGSLNVNIAVGLKSFMQYMKQNITISIIVILMTFVTVFAFTVNYNFNVDNTSFIRLVGLEKADISVIYYGDDVNDIFDEISQMEHVENTARVAVINVTLSKGDKEAMVINTVCDDFRKFKTDTIVKGRNPIHDNEIVITGLTAKSLDAKIGDVISVKGTGKEQEFLVVGLNQHIEYMGQGANTTEEGMIRINPDYTPSGLYLYLDNSENIPAVMKAVEERYTDKQINIADVQKSYQTLLLSFNNAMVALCIGCIVITIAIISLVILLLINIKLLKERTRIGVAKALGYTTRQLVLQVIVSFCPVCIFGALIGTILAVFLTNPAFSTMLSFSGISNSNLTMNPFVITLVFLSISVFSIAVTALVSFRIRKISPRELFD